MSLILIIKINLVNAISSQSVQCSHFSREIKEESCTHLSLYSIVSHGSSTIDPNQTHMSGSQTGPCNSFQVAAEMDLTIWSKLW